MLTLSRRVGEKLILTLPDGRTIEVVVVSRQGDKIKIGVRADPDIPIFRSELLSELPGPHREKGTSGL